VARYIEEEEESKIVILMFSNNMKTPSNATLSLLLITGLVLIS
jgi:hypothetical protein